MSTEYKLDKDGDVCIDEASSELCITVIDEFDSDKQTTSRYYTPEEMVHILVKGLQACSYNMDHDKFAKVLKEATDASFDVPYLLEEEEPFVFKGREYVRICVIAEGACDGCSFENNAAGCDQAPDCSAKIYVPKLEEYKEKNEEDN